MIEMNISQIEVSGTFNKMVSVKSSQRTIRNLTLFYHVRPKLLRNFRVIQRNLCDMLKMGKNDDEY